MAAARLAEITVGVDSEWHIERLSKSATDAEVRLGIVIDIDVGHHRCGIEPRGSTLLVIAAATARASALTLMGIMGYEGHAVLRPEERTRRMLVTQATEILASARERLQAADHACPIVSGGGTGTLDLQREAGVLTEAQVGSYVLMDTQYAALDLGFEPALYCLGTVISRRSPTEGVLDAGLKAISGDEGVPRSTLVGIEVRGLHDKHTVLRVDASVTLAIDDVVPLIPAHVDPTVNLHDTLFARRPDGGIERWPVDGRRVATGLL